MKQRLSMAIYIMISILLGLTQHVEGKPKEDKFKPDESEAIKITHRVLVVKLGSINEPSAIAIDADKNIYISDSENDCVNVYDIQGHKINSIKIPNEINRPALFIDDLFVDKSNNLYIASRQRMKIYVHDARTHILRDINLADKEIYWDEKSGWDRGAIQIARMTVDSVGSIYLQGFDELIKFSNDGKVVNKWAPIGYTRATNFVLDEFDNLYLLRQGKIIEKYSKSNNLISAGLCGDLYSMIIDGLCKIPEYIDKNGNLYWSEINSSVVVKADRNKNKTKELPITYVYDNTEKFDRDGNLYVMYNTGKKYRIEVFTWK